MSQVRATTERIIDAPPERVREALADYTQTRPRILTEEFSDYRVESGGQGAGTVVHWKLAATRKRVRDCRMSVEQHGDQLVERDENSSLVTTWTVAPAGEGSSSVRVSSTWTGASGIAGFFERRFAPPGLRRIYDGVLAKLDAAVRS